MKRPFFSILLPTKNRSEIVGDAIQSALQQSFPDFELILSDNDDSPTATANAVARFQDPRIRYFRTSGTLPMYQNWEHVFDQAAGDHVLILEDKIRLVPNALEILHHHLQQHGDVPISYRLKFAKTPTIPAPKLFPPARWLRSEDVIKLFCQFSQSFFQLLPKGLDSCAPRLLLQQLKAHSPTGYLFSHISPDYASGFLMLSQVPGFLRIDEPLIYVPNNWMWQSNYSNGQAGYKKGQQIQRFMRELPVTTADILQWVPVKAEWLWLNAVIYDYFTKYRRNGSQPQLDWMRYHGFCIILVLLGMRVGGNMRPEIQAIGASLRRQGFWFAMRVAGNVMGRLLGLGADAAKEGILDKSLRKCRIIPPHNPS